MHPHIFAAFNRICRERAAGGDVLEIGAVPSRESLLCLPALATARSRIGVNIAGDTSFEDWRIIDASANDLRCFADASFDTVLSNSVFEHDPYFWRSLREIRRVARRGALVVFGVPGFAIEETADVLHRLARLPVIGAAVRRAAPSRLASTPTLGVHTFPGDYYRFSAQAMREVLLDGFVERDVFCVLSPPRIVGAAIVPKAERA